MDKAGIDLLVDLATRFYVRGQTQAEIARELRMDPSTISRHLKRARDEGIVRIEIRRPGRLHVDLGRELANRFGIGRALVAEDGADGSAVAISAADYLGSLLHNGIRVGLSFGRMPSAVVHALAPGIVSDVEISLLLGGFGRAMPGIQGHELARHAASLYPRSRIHYLQAPLIVDSADIRGAMLRDGSIQSALRAASSSELALVGIGALNDDAPLVRYGHLDTDSRQTLVRSGAVGDVCARFFDVQGRPVSTIDDRLIAVEREQLGRIPTVVAVACGSEKYEAIRGALRTGYVDVLVTDESTARALLASEPGMPRWQESEGGKAS